MCVCVRGRDDVCFYNVHRKACRMWSGNSIDIYIRSSDKSLW